MARPKNQLSPSMVAAPQQSPNPDGPLTEMQRAFVHHLVHNKMTQTAAARQAGFSDPNKYGTQLMKTAKVLKAIEIERAEYAKASGMSKAKVIDGFAEAIDLGRIKGDPVAMIAGWREIGKMCGFYEPSKSKIEVSVTGQVMVERLNAMSDEELLRLAEGDTSVLEGEFKVIP